MHDVINIMPVWRTQCAVSGLACHGIRDTNCAWCTQDIAGACTAIPECDLFGYFPFGRSVSYDPSDFHWNASAVLKTARNYPADNDTLKYALCVM